MNPKYFIELPIYAYPIDELITLNNESDDIQLILYGGAPDSPLNGGRFNYSIDGFPLRNRLFYKINQKQLDRLNKSFYKTITLANENGIPFFIAFTNMFIKESEISEKNLTPLEFLIQNNDKYNVKNGIIINNQYLENYLRERYQNNFLFISSCTKYVQKERILSQEETIEKYVADSPKYEYIVLTPQDSRRKEVIQEVLQKTQGNIITICNSYCSDKCNSYHHYAYMSQENKKSLLSLKAIEILKDSYSFLLRKENKCSVWKYQFKKMDVSHLIKMQINAGVTNFKIGRGLGSKCLKEVLHSIKTQ